VFQASGFRFLVSSFKFQDPNSKTQIPRPKLKISETLQTLHTPNPSNPYKRQGDKARGDKETLKPETHTKSI